MTESLVSAWESELKTLLGQLRGKPSHDNEAAKARVLVLEKLLADHYRAARTADPAPPG